MFRVLWNATLIYCALLFINVFALAFALNRKFPAALHSNTAWIPDPGDSPASELSEDINTRFVAGVVKGQRPCLPTGAYITIPETLYY